MKIWVNTIVHNEENFIWFTISSVIDFVDKVLIYDTGSTDKTTKIIKELTNKYGSKIEFEESGEVDEFEFTKLRQKMLEQSKCDWILVLDGDEIWWENSIRKIVSEINKRGNQISGVVVPMIVSIGDIYHYQEREAGKYEILGKKGHLSLKFVNKKIPGLHADLPYGKEGFFDINDVPIQEKKNLIFIDSPFLHVTHLRRSQSKRKQEKFKHELGKTFTKDFKLPEVLYKPHPKIVNSPFVNLSGIDLLKSLILTPVRKIKRRILN